MKRLIGNFGLHQITEQKFRGLLNLSKEQVMQKLKEEYANPKIIPNAPVPENVVHVALRGTLRLNITFEDDKAIKFEYWKFGESNRLVIKN